MLYPSSTSNHNGAQAPVHIEKVVLYPSSTSNHNGVTLPDYLFLLCYILLLHQTTTTNVHGRKTISLCYILLLHQTTTNAPVHIDKSKLCYILLLHQTTTFTLSAKFGVGCVISFFYIKPQPQIDDVDYPIGCVISFFYIKPQPTLRAPCALPGCVISFFYIKPQPIWDNPLRWKPLKGSFVYRKWCWCVTSYGQKY